MNTTLITVRYVNPAKGRGPASVKDANDIYWKFWPKEIPVSSFVPGRTYKIAYKNEPYEGKDQFYITKQKLMEAPAPAPASAPANTGKYGARDDETAERIFTCGALNASLSNPNFTPTELSEESLVLLVKRLRDVWSHTFGAPRPVPQKPQHDDMNDEIPF